MAHWNDDWDVPDLDDLLNDREGAAPPPGNTTVSEEDFSAEDFPQSGDDFSEEDFRASGVEFSEEDFPQSGDDSFGEDFPQSGDDSFGENPMESEEESFLDDFEEDGDFLPEGFTEWKEAPPSGKPEVPPAPADRGRQRQPVDEETTFLPLEFLDPEDIPGDFSPEETLSSVSGDGRDDFISEAARRTGAGGPSRQKRDTSRRSGSSPRRSAGQQERKDPQRRSAAGDSSGGRTGGRQGRNSRSDRRGIPIHLILPVIIVIVAAVAVVRFVIWNAGVDINIDSSANANRFNVEVNDSMVTLSSSDLEGIVDDGITTILCLGNDPFSGDTSDSGLAAQIAGLGDCEVINAAFPDSQVTCENATYTTDTLDDMDDIFNLFYVSYAIAIDDYTSMATVATAHSDETYANAVEALENTDFSTVDIIAIMYDGIDYLEGMAMYNEEVPEELTTYVGSLYNSILLLREAYPHIRIVFLSPYYAEYDGASARTTDLGNGTLVDYYQWAYDTCGSEGISFLDNYYGSINENNFEEYLNDDMSLNSDGAKKIADHFVYKVIQGNYAEYNVEELAVAEE